MNYQELTIIVQAGGRGSRLRHHTWNKPKCLVSVRGKPILYHLFDHYKDAKFIIIGDYAFEQLKLYLEINCPAANYELHKTDQKGTAAGIGDVIKNVSPENPVMLIWSDLILKNRLSWPHVDLPTIATTDAFTCRWSLNAKGFLENQPSDKSGIPGIFFFPKARLLSSPPNSGEFVKWFSENIKNFAVSGFSNLEEVGDFITIEKGNDREGFSRFFNEVTFDEMYVTKRVLDPNYANVHQNEVDWYKSVQRLGFRRIPKIVSFSPLKMERIQGHHPFLMSDLTDRERRAVLADFLDALLALHDSDSIISSPEDITEMYYTKTVTRVKSIAPIIPGFDRDYITINGRKCRNYFASNNLNQLRILINSLQVDTFRPIHGDPTFSNAIVDKYLRVWFIDPRGAFAKPGLYGDVWYDFSKVYYSCIGGYDLFNRRKFKLHIDHSTVEILMQEPSFLTIASDVFNDYFGNNLKRIQLIHGLIWLSLSGYVRDDIDSVIGAFYLGLYWLELGISGS